MKIGAVSSNFDTRDIQLIKQLRRNKLKATDFNLAHLDATTRIKLMQMLLEFADVFSKRLFIIGRIKAIQPKIKVGMNNLPSACAYPISQALQGEVKRQLAELQEANRIERFNLHISFRPILKKKDNPLGDPLKQKWRLVIDYRKLNEHIKYLWYKLPVVQHLLDKLRENKIYTTLDLSSSFWQIALKVEDRNLTTFSTPYGNFRYVSAPQGLSPN